MRDSMSPPHWPPDTSPYRNGSHAWPPPSPTDILYRLHEEIGGLKAGMMRSLENDRELFEQNRDQRERLATIEQRLSQITVTPPSASQPPPPASFAVEMVGLVRDLMKEREMRLLALLAGLGLAGFLTPDVRDALVAALGK